MSVFFLTGSSRGLGRAIALALSQRGASVLLSGRKADALEALAAELRGQFAVQVETRALDLAGGDLEARLREIVSAHNVGLLVYNAALSIIGPFVTNGTTISRGVVDRSAPTRVT